MRVGHKLVPHAVVQTTAANHGTPCIPLDTPRSCLFDGCKIGQDNACGVCSGCISYNMTPALCFHLPFEASIKPADILKHPHTKRQRDMTYHMAS